MGIDINQYHQKKKQDSIRSEEVLLFLVLFISINTHNRMEINL